MKLESKTTTVPSQPQTLHIYKHGTSLVNVVIIIIINAIIPIVVPHM